MTKAMPFLQKAILLSYDPRPFGRSVNCVGVNYTNKCNALGWILLCPSPAVKTGGSKNSGGTA